MSTDSESKFKDGEIIVYTRHGKRELRRVCDVSERSGGGWQYGLQNVQYQQGDDPRSITTPGGEHWWVNEEEMEKPQPGRERLIAYILAAKVEKRKLTRRLECVKEELERMNAAWEVLEGDRSKFEMVPALLDDSSDQEEKEAADA